MPHRITVLPAQRNIDAAPGENLLAVLRSAGLAPDAPCGGRGTCGKCRVIIDGEEKLACRTEIDRDMTVTIPAERPASILTDSTAPQGEIAPVQDGWMLAFDLGTTTVVGNLLHGKTGRVLACESMRNPQADFGADVISRIQYALGGQMETLYGDHCQPFPVACVHGGRSAERSGRML